MPLDFCQSNIILTKILLKYETFYTSIKKEVKYNYMSSKAGEDMANIREIAKRAGVSVSTVSRVLNGYPYVKEEKRKAVWDVIHELNYKKNINAVHLSKGKTNIVGVMLPTINHPYFSMIVEGISEEALRYGYHLLFFQTNYDIHKELEALEMLRVKQMDGLIICSHTIHLETIASYTDDGPIILCEDIQETNSFSVYIDHYHAFALGMDYLIKKGHSKIGYCLSRPTSINSQKRMAAYKDALQRIHAPVRPDWMFHHCLHMNDGKRIVSTILSLEEKPTALLVASDQVAAGIVLWGKTYGLRVPNDLAIVSFDNHPISEALHITTIELPLSLMGKKAFQMVYNQLTNEKTEPKKEKLPVRLIERASV